MLETFEKILDSADYQCVTLYMGGYKFNLHIIVLNAVGVAPQYNLGNWYIYFYIYALCVLPFIEMLFRNQELLRMFILTVVMAVLSFLIPQQSYGLRAINQCCFYTPVLAVGYLSAKTNVLFKMSIRIDKKYIWAVIAIFVLFLRCIKGGICGFAVDTIFAPIFIMSISAICTGYGNNIVIKSLSVLGKYSTFMWFFHAIPFSTATRHLFQESQLWVNNVFFLFIVVTIISFIMSKIFTDVIVKIERR